MFVRACAFFGKKKKWCNRAADRQTGTVLQKELPSDEVVIQTIKSEMDIDINVKDINQTHQVCAKTENKHRPIIVQFVRYSEQ